MNASYPPIHIPNPFEDADDRDDAAEAALARFHAQWPPERCERLGRMMDGDYSQVWAEALAPKETDAPADDEVRGLIDDADLLRLSKGQRRFVRENGSTRATSPHDTSGGEA